MLKIIVFLVLSSFLIYKLIQTLDHQLHQSFEKYHNQIFKFQPKSLNRSHLKYINQLTHQIHYNLAQNASIIYIQTTQQFFPKQLIKIVDTKLRMYTVFHYNITKVNRFLGKNISKVKQSAPNINKENNNKQIKERKKMKEGLHAYIIQSIIWLGLEDFVNNYISLDYRDSITKFTLQESGILRGNNWFYDWITKDFLYKHYYINFLKQKASNGKKVIIILDDISEIQKEDLVSIVSVFQSQKINNLHLLLFCYQNDGLRKYLNINIKDGIQIQTDRKSKLHIFNFSPDIITQKRKRLQQMHEQAKKKKEQKIKAATDKIKKQKESININITDL